MRVSATTLLIIGAIAALVAVGVTDQVLPAADQRTVAMRPWIAARAMGITAYLLLAMEVGLGLVLSHPRNTAQWRKTRQVFPWHEMVTVFTGAFLALHVALLAVDPYADVGVIGALVPGYSAYRPVAVGLGSVALYALIVTAVTAKWTRLLPSGWWLKVHRFAGVAFLVTWLHAVLAGADGGALLPLYLITGIAILAGVGHRWWTARVRPIRPGTLPGAAGQVIERPTSTVVATEDLR
jgi:methionine sulfoxide reductase heme-binding subunit